MPCSNDCEGCSCEPAPPPKLICRPDILTSGGVYFNYAAPDPTTVSIRDIAHHLSNVCRFAGATREFYSVAQHLYLTSYLVPKEHALAALLHDAHEAYVGDMPTPLKQLIPQYKELELFVETTVLARFGLSLPLHPCVKEADLRMLATEQRDLLPPHDDEWAIIRGVEPCRDPINPWPPRSAEMCFLHRFQEITGVKP